MTELSDRPDERSDSLLGGAHSRRSFLKGMGLAAGATAVLPAAVAAQPGERPAAPEIPGVRVLGRAPRPITLRVNGQERTITVEPRTSLLDALRGPLDLTGAKEVCDRGTCGCCTVLLDGKAVVACLMLAMDAVGHEIVTIEGLAEDPRSAQLINAYCENDAAQCGYCIPGFVMSSAALLAKIPNPSPEQVKQGLAGNLCRCGTYTKIFDAVAAAAAKGGVA